MYKRYQLLVNSQESLQKASSPRYFWMGFRPFINGSSQREQLGKVAVFSRENCFSLAFQTGFISHFLPELHLKVFLDSFPSIHYAFAHVSRGTVAIAIDSGHPRKRTFRFCVPEILTITGKGILGDTHWHLVRFDSRSLLVAVQLRFPHPMPDTARAMERLLLPLLLQVLVVRANPDARRLFEDLLSGYNKLVRPTENSSRAVQVKFRISLGQIVDVVRFSDQAHMPRFDRSMCRLSGKGFCFSSSGGNIVILTILPFL